MKTYYFIAIACLTGKSFGCHIAPAVKSAHAFNIEQMECDKILKDAKKVEISIVKNHYFKKQDNDVHLWIHTLRTLTKQTYPYDKPTTPPHDGSSPFIALPDEILLLILMQTIRGSYKNLCIVNSINRKLKLLSQDRAFNPLKAAVALDWAERYKGTAPLLAWKHFGENVANIIAPMWIPEALKKASIPLPLTKAQWFYYDQGHAKQINSDGTTVRKLKIKGNSTDKRLHITFSEMNPTKPKVHTYPLLERHLK